MFRKAFKEILFQIFMKEIGFEELFEGTRLAIEVCSFMAKLKEARDPRYPILHQKSLEFLRDQGEDKIVYPNGRHSNFGDNNEGTWVIDSRKAYQSFLEYVRTEYPGLIELSKLDEESFYGV